MIKAKFNYTPLSRESVDGKRLYSTPTGKLPSVTTILGATADAGKTAGLDAWRKAVGKDRAQAITTEAANRGTRMHTYLERYITTGTHAPRGSNPFGWASHAMAQVVIDEGLPKMTEYWGVEVPLYFPGIYAGTTDVVGLHENTPAISDFKQTNKPKKEEWIDDYKVQLAAYAEAHNELHGTDIKKGVVIMCVKPEVDKNFGILTPPRYQEFIIEGAEFEKWRIEWWRRVELFYSLAS